MEPLLLSGPEWLAVLRIGIGLWWLESWRHKDKKAWFERNAGIDWAASVAADHKWAFVRRMFERVVAPRPKAMSYLIVLSELAIGLGLVLGFLTPVAAAGALLLNAFYLVLMIHDWAEQGQNWTMMVAEAVIIGTQSWEHWSIDHAIGWF